MVKLCRPSRGVRVPPRTGGETVVAIGNLGMEGDSMNETTGHILILTMVVIAFLAFLAWFRK